MSEWGAFRRDGTADMVALRKQALVCVRFFHELEAREEIAAKYYLGHCPVSIIEKGRLVDKDHPNPLVNGIDRSLRIGGGIYEGKITLGYSDNYNDGRGQGGSGGIIIGDVTDVRIEGGDLVIEGIDCGKPKEYRYRIQESPDTEAKYTKRIKTYEEWRRIVEAEYEPGDEDDDTPKPTGPRQLTLDDWGVIA